MGMIAWLGCAALTVFAVTGGAPDRRRQDGLAGTGLLLVALLASVVQPPAALADAQPSGLTGDYVARCGTRPADYAGSDVVVAELRGQRQATWDACAAAQDDGANRHADATAQIAAIEAASAATQVVHVDNPPSGTVAATVTYSATSATQVDQEFAGLHTDLWIITGAIVGAMAMTEALRRIFP